MPEFFYGRGYLITNKNRLIAKVYFQNHTIQFYYFRAMTNEKAVAEKLLQINAIRLNPQQPFTWASGWKSPIYCDNRKTLSFPYIRDFVKSELCNVIFESFPDADMLAGVATAGIAWGAMAADTGASLLVVLNGLRLLGGAPSVR